MRLEHPCAGYMRSTFPILKRQSAKGWQERCVRGLTDPCPSHERQGPEQIRQISWCGLPSPVAPATKILILSTFHASGQAIRAFEAGAHGYVLKTSIRRELLEGIRTVAGGRRFVCTEIAKEVAVQVFDERLTEREVQLLNLMAEGNQNKQIAWSLSLSENTIKGMLKTLFLKLGAKDRTHAVVLASRMGWIRL